MAPRMWKRPLTLMYDNNYKYGTNLYSGALGDIEKKYLSSMSRTQLSRDRPDVNLSTFAGSNLAAGSSMTLDRRSRATDVHDEGYDLRKVKSLADFDVYRNRIDLSSSILYPSASYRPVVEPVIHEEVEERANRRRRRRREDMAPLDLPVIHHQPPMSRYERPHGETLDAAFWMDKCRHLQNELDAVVQRVAEAEAKIAGETVGAKNKIQQGIGELTQEIEDTSRHSSELQKIIKHQAKHLMELQSLYEEVQRILSHTNEELSNSQRRCANLQTELDSVRHSIEQASRSRESMWR